MIRWPALLLLLMSFLFEARAASLSETFNSRTRLASGTAIWNQALGKIHPTLQVVNYKVGFTPVAVDVGDGSHGAFNEANYSRFSVGGDISGQKIRFDTAVYPILKVTSFYLAPGWILEPVGDNPLIIYSLTDVIIEGEIWCHGHDGGNASGGTPGLGGADRCGGGRGGDGGDPLPAGNPGGDGQGTHASVTGGFGGNFNGNDAVCGGGGGSWNTTSPPTPGALASASGGNPGTSASDPEFTIIAGGAGGGGGASSTLSGGAAGAGGGGGGGSVIIHAVRDFRLGVSPSSAIGSINANGGAGGSSNVEGGAGGGGGGGSVLVYAGGHLGIYNDDNGNPLDPGASQANNGLGGTNTAARNGGNGGPGRSWFVSNTFNFVGFYAPPEQAPVDPNTGKVEFDPAPQNIVSQPIDLANSYIQINSLETSPLSAGFVFEVAGSSDNFLSDDTGFTTDLSLLALKRYVKFRLTITATDVNTPDMIDTATINYSPGERKKFDLAAAGCGRIDSPPASGNGFFLIVIFGFLLFLKFKAQRQKAFDA